MSGVHPSFPGIQEKAANRPTSRCFMFRPRQSAIVPKTFGPAMPPRKNESVHPPARKKPANVAGHRQSSPNAAKAVAALSRRGRYETGLQSSRCSGVISGCDSTPECRRHQNLCSPRLDWTAEIRHHTRIPTWQEKSIMI